MTYICPRTEVKSGIKSFLIKIHFMAILWVLLNNRIIKRGILCLFFWKILNIPVPRKIHIYTLDILKSSTGNLKGSPATIICFPALYAEVKILYIKIVFLTLSQVDVYKLYNLIRAILYFQI